MDHRRTLFKEIHAQTQTAMDLAGPDVREESGTLHRVKRPKNGGHRSGRITGIPCQQNTMGYQKHNKLLHTRKHDERGGVWETLGSDPTSPRIQTRGSIGERRAASRTHPIGKGRHASAFNLKPANVPTHAHTPQPRTHATRPNKH